MRTTLGGRVDNQSVRFALGNRFVCLHLRSKARRDDREDRQERKHRPGNMRSVHLEDADFRLAACPFILGPAPQRYDDRKGSVNPTYICIDGYLR